MTIGPAWQHLCDEFELELHSRDPHGRIRASITAEGLLHVEVTSQALSRREARHLTRKWEARAGAMCEQCGGSVGPSQATPMGVTVLCADCAASGGGDHL